ncbi:MAG: D-beta-hydroxybutyrate dehydrogenase [Gammaproteobacteria bacterium]|nr:D-beta-hydroxybutyrate dehydrogenase [Gammaproteobacteria bacterium]
MSFKGKTAIITGSTSGIGLGIAQGFATQGINIVMNGFGDEGEIEKERAALEETGVRTVYNGADMTKPHEITAMIEDTVKEFGSVDMVLNNAGIQLCRAG